VSIVVEINEVTVQNDQRHNVDTSGRPLSPGPLCRKLSRTVSPHQSCVAKTSRSSSISTRLLHVTSPL